MQSVKQPLLLRKSAAAVPEICIDTIAGVVS